MIALTFVLTGILIASGAVLSACTGFGFVIATLPIMVMLYPPKSAVALVLVVGFSGVLIQWFRVRYHMSKRLAVLLCLGSAMGIPLGGMVMVLIDPATLKALIGISVLVAAALLLLRRTDADLPVRRPHSLAALATGFGAGVLSTSVGQSGPPIALLLSWTREDKAVVRATLVTFFVFTNGFALLTLFLNGILTTEIALTGVGLVPFYVIGLILGDRVFNRTSQALYQRLVTGVISVAAVIGLINGISALAARL